MDSTDHCTANTVLSDHLATRARTWPHVEDNPQLNVCYGCELTGPHDEHAAYLTDTRRGVRTLWLHWANNEPVLREHFGCGTVHAGERCSLYADHPGHCDPPVDAQPN